jgi:formate hydrogenlyase subunit 6/NADH:ubiquinone oxidoreductase subunit I
MNVLNLLFENLSRGTVTLRFPERPPTPAAYRGLVEMDRGRCEGCWEMACDAQASTHRPQNVHWPGS